ncbi:adhesion G-protein coupled receptor D1-like [Haliotis rufescens]|uniref:adhesion G-protein coupled receptor D1-like n=1 Tax=Haliotis rufescens TaxID=6454 RepID=UPI00201F507C|nr:adhesion G-protein coupled receptor D1-like [Haliotis rufescens]
MHCSFHVWNYIEILMENHDIFRNGFKFLLIFFSPIAVCGLCRDTDARCYPAVGDQGWYAEWCDGTHSFVINGCPYMCALCKHELYTEANLYFPFDEIKAGAFSESQTKGLRQTEVVSEHVTVDPSGRSGGMLSINSSECLDIGSFAGTCVSDPGLCSSGVTYGFFFNMLRAPDSDITILTSGAHGPSRGVYFGYNASSSEFQMTLKTSTAVYSVQIPEHNINLTRTLLVHLAFTWSPSSDVKVYVDGDAVKFATAVNQPTMSDSYNKLMIGCKELGDKWGEYLKVDELALWRRELTAMEVRMISHPVSDVDTSTGSTPQPTTMAASHHVTTAVVNTPDTLSAFLAFSSSVKETLNSSSVVDVSNILDSLSTTSLIGTLSNDDTAHLISSVSDIVDTLLRPDNHDIWEHVSETDPGVLPSLVQSVDNVLGKITDHLLDGDTDINIQHRRDNFEVTVKSALQPVERLTFMSEGSMVLSTQADRNVALVSNVFRGIGEIFPTDYNATWAENTSGAEIKISNHIVGVSLYPSNTTDQKQINLTFSLSQPHNYTVIPKCVFLDFGDRGQDDSRWSDIGCSTIVMDTGVICSCNHLTNFAILMQVVAVELSSVDEQALEVITFVGCTLSLLGAILTVLTFLFLKIYTDRVLIHLNLAVSIIGAQILLLMEEAIDRGTSACVGVTVLLYYFNMAVFSWMLVEGVQLFIQIVVVFTAESRMKVFYTIGWGLPFLAAGALLPVFHENLGQMGVCWLSPLDNSIWAFAVPAVLVVCTNLIILMLVMRVILSLSVAMEENKIRSIKTAVKASLLLLPLLGCTWLFGVFTFSGKTVVFQYLFAATNSLQGLLLFICHCIYNSEVRDVFLRRKSSWDLSRQLKTHNKVEPISDIRPSSFKARPAVQTRQPGDRVITPPTGSSVVGSNPESDTSKTGRRKSSPAPISVESVSK